MLLFLTWRITTNSTKHLPVSHMIVDTVMADSDIVNRELDSIIKKYDIIPGIPGDWKTHSNKFVSFNDSCTKYKLINTDKAYGIFCYYSVLADYEYHLAYPKENRGMIDKLKEGSYEMKIVKIPK